MSKLSVLIAIDYWGWAFDFVSRGIQKYSKHNVTVKRWNEIDIFDFRKHDVFFSMNDSCWFCMNNKNKEIINRLKIRRCVGIRGWKGKHANRILKGWIIGCVNQKIYDDLMKEKNLPVKGVYLTRNGVDTEIFKSVDRPEKRFVVGWAGNSHRPEKRFSLLRDVDFPLLVQNKHDNKYRVKGRSRDEMIVFYNKIDCFVNVSSGEGMPQTILEAAATRLPIVVTDVGGMSEFIDEKWIIPAFPVKTCIKTLNEKLQILKDNPKLRFEVGNKNLRKVLNKWDWKYIVEDYDRMFEGA